MARVSPATSNPYSKGQLLGKSETGVQKHCPLKASASVVDVVHETKRRNEMTNVVDDDDCEIIMSYL